MTKLAILFLVLGVVASVMSILTWRTGGRGLLAVGVLNASLGGFILAPAGWPRYVLVAAFLAVFVWSMAGTPREVFARYRWGLLLVGAAMIGILVITFSPALVEGNARLVVNVIGILAGAGLATLAFLSLKALREAAKQTR